MKNPLVSIIIPVREISDYLRNENLPAFVTQTYKNFEVIVLPNKSSEEDRKLLSKYRWLKIIPTGKITRPAEKRDIGAKNAKGSIVAFIDDDAYPDNNWLKKAVQIFENKNIEAVCGPGLIPQNTNIWEKIFDEVLQSSFGSGGYHYRFIKQHERYVDDYPSMNFFIKKNVFDQLGGFNNEYWPGEDSKLCEDLVYKQNGKIFYHPEVCVYHHRRNSLLGFLKQHTNYGFHRGAFFAHGDKNSRRLSYLIPTFFVFYILFIILFSLYSILNTKYFILYTPLLTYLFFGLVLFTKSFFNTKNIIIALATFPVLFLTHITYGTMFIKGFIKGCISKKQIYA